MRANIYIRKENEAKWAAVADKSEWVNALLANSDDTSNYGKTIKTPVGPMVTVLSETLPELPVPTKACKHGMDPELCKFAKPGQKCKL